MSELTTRIIFGGDFDELRFKRVMAGEYRARTINGWTYTIDRHCTGCDACTHEHQCWLVQLHPSYNVHEEVGRFRTLTDARIGAARHAIDAGLIEDRT